MAATYTCDNCMEKRKGECWGDKRICDFFKPAPNISQEIKDNWPKLGNASYITYKRSGRSKKVNSNRSTNDRTRQYNVATSINHSKETSSPNIDIKHVQKQINRISYRCYSDLSYNSKPIEFTIVVSRNDGMAVKVKQDFTKIIDVIFLKSTELETIFNNIQTVNLPSQRLFRKVGVTEDTWELNIDGTIYAGNIVPPNFIESIKKIVNYDKIYYKYYSAFVNYLKFTQKLKLY